MGSAIVPSDSRATTSAGTQPSFFVSVRQLCTIIFS